jgi:hypothetical protein
MGTASNGVAPTQTPQVCRLPIYPDALQRHSGYSESELVECATALADLHVRAPTAILNAVFKKYCSLERQQVAILQPPIELLSKKASQQ